MSVNFEQQVTDAMRRATDRLSPPALAPQAIRRGARRRRVLALTAQALAAVVVLAGAAGGATLLRAESRPTASGRPAHAPAFGQPASPPSAAPVATVTALAKVKAFYDRYLTDRAHGRQRVEALISADAASWYAPVLTAPAGPGGPPGCDLPAGAIHLSFRPVGVLGGPPVTADSPALAAGEGQAVVVARWTVRDELTGPLATSVFAAGSPYLRQVRSVTTSRSLTYDPVLCGSATGYENSSYQQAGHDQVAAGRPELVGAGAAGLVAVTTSRGRALAVVVAGAKGWTVADIACQQP